MLASKLEGAIAELRNQLESNPLDRAVIARMAHTLVAQGSYREAIEWLKRLDSLK